jgi:lipid-binding SYLF domain-containing protein
MKETTMRRLSKKLTATITAGILIGLCGGCASDMTGVISSDVSAFRRIEASKGAIPHDVLAQAKAVAIFTSTQAGLVIGGKGGDGLFVKRLGDGWSPPLAVDLIEGSIGLQIGAQYEDIVYIFTTDQAVQRFLDKGRYAVAQMSGSFGESSGQADGADLPTDPVLIYNRTSGVYGGMVVGGKGFAIDEDLNRKTYGPTVTTDQIVNGKVDPPPGTLVLWKILDSSSADDRQATVDTSR